MILSSLIYSNTPPPFITAPTCHYGPASWLKNCKMYQFLLNRTVKENFQFCHASENIRHHYNSLVAANTIGHSLSRRAHSRDWCKAGGSGLAVHTEKANNGAKSWTLESLLSAFSPQVCCVSGEILVTPVQRHRHLARTRYLYFQVLLPFYPQTDFSNTMNMAFLTFDTPFFFLLALLQSRSLVH